MNSPAPFLRYLGLDEGTDDRSIRRAYAQRLKTIDQEAEPEAFQALRDAYEAAMGWAQYMQQRAIQATQQNPQKEVDAIAEGLVVAADPSAHPQSTPPAPHPEGQAPSQAWLADSDAVARTVLDEFLECTRTRPPMNIGEGRKLLDGMLDDSRLLDLDAQFLFEWGLASILAQGWKPGHEHLFGPAMTRFKWREDRGRLLRLGPAGRFLDVAVREVDMYDRQPDMQRTPQRDMIRRLRDDQRPGDRMLIQKLPLIEQLCATWPNWLHVITNTQNIAKWRRWNTEVPAWRRVLTRKPHGTLERARRPAGTVPNTGKKGPGTAGFVFLALLFFGSLSHMLSSNRPPPSYTPPVSSYPRLANPASGQPEPIHFPSPLAPSRPAPRAVVTSAPALPAIAEIPAAKKAAANLVMGKVDPKKCSDAVEILGYHGQEHQKGSFGAAFDRLVVNCLLKDLFQPPVPLAAIEVSVQRNQKRTKALMDGEIAAARSSLTPTPPSKQP
jgi:hypothetical protein